MEQQKAAALRDAERAEEALDSERSVVAQLTLNLKDEKSRVGVLQETNKRLEDELRDARNLLADHRTRIQSRTIDQDQFKAQLNDKNLEINRYIAEIQMISSENAQMAFDVEEIANELEVALSEIEKKTKDLEEARDLIDKNDGLITELTDERDALQIKIEDLVEQLEVQQDSLGSMSDVLRDEKHELEIRILHLESENSDRSAQIEQLVRENGILRNATTGAIIEELRDEIKQKDEEIENLKLKHQSALEDFELLSQDWNRLDRALNAKSDHVERNEELNDSYKQHGTIRKLREKLDVAQEQRALNNKRIVELGDLVAEREKHIFELRSQLEKYETNGFGLKEAVKEIKDTKLLVSIREREIAEHVVKLNDLEAQASDLAEENAEFRRQLGLDPSTKIDLTNLKKLKIVELEQAQSLIITLKKEIESLEEERIQLKSSLRMQAMERGERAVALGLTAKDLASVEEYADNLRNGSSSKNATKETVGATISRPVLNISQLDKLTLELERLHLDGIETKEKLLNAQEFSRKLTEENGLLKSTMQEISHTILDNSADSNRDPIIAKIDALIQILSGKARMNESGNAIAIVESSIHTVNRKLRKELEKNRQEVNFLTGKVQQLEVNVKKSTEENVLLRKKMENRERRYVDVPAELSLSSLSGYISLSDQLIQCLGELQDKDDELKACEFALERYKKFYRSIYAKSQLMYQECNAQREANELTQKELKEKYAEAESNANIAQIRVHELETLLSNIEQSSDEVKRKAIETQRKVIVLQVNEKALTRRHVALTDIEKLLRKENLRLKHELIEIDKSSREVVTRLRQAKRECDDRIESFQERLSDSVPRQHFVFLENRLKSETSKIKLLLERESSWIQQRIQQEEAQNEVIRLRKALDQTKLELVETSVKYEKAQQQLNAQPDTDASKDRKTIAAFEVQLEVANNRLAFADGKVKAMEQTEADLKARLASAEKMYIDAKEESSSLREEILTLENEYTGGAKRELFEKTVGELQATQAVVKKLQEEVQKHKELSELAANLSADLTRLQNEDDKEKNVLRSAVLELQMVDDDKLIIGKLHHHILALQLSESMALRKIDSLNYKCLQLETSLLQTEKLKDERERLLFETRLENKARIQMLQRTVSDLRIKFSGLIPLAQHKRLCEAMRSLDKRKRELEVSLSELTGEQKILQDKLDENTVKLNEQDELLQTLTATANSNKRVAAWHKKMLETQIENLRLQKESTSWRATATTSQNEVMVSQAKIVELEDALFSLQSEFDQQQLDWEARQGELELTIQNFEVERDQIFQSGTSDELKLIVPNKDLPIGDQLESSLRMLLERTKLLKAQEIKVAKLEGAILKLEAKLKTNAEKLLQKDSDLTSLQLQLAKDEKSAFAESAVKDTAQFVVSQDREAEAIRAAKRTIETIRKQVAQKEELVEKYRLKIQSMRKEFAEKENQHKTELEKKSNIIEALKKDQIDRASKVPDISPGVNQREIDHEKEAVAQMEKLLVAKEQAYDELQKKLDKIISELRSEKDALVEKCSAFERQLVDKEMEIHSKAVELHEANVQLEKLSEIASKPPPKDLTDVVQRLENEISQRDSKINALTKAVNKLKEQLLSAAKELAETNIRQTNETSNFQEMLETKTSDLTTKIVQLESKVKRLNAAIDAHKQSEAEMELDMHRMSEILIKKDKDIVAKSAENVRLQTSLKELKSRRQNSIIVSSSANSGEMVPVKESSEFFEQIDDVHRTSLPELPGGLTGAKESVLTGQLLQKEKWALEKKYQHKIETYKKKLTEKVKECEDLLKSNEALKTSLERSEKDRFKIQAKLHNLSVKLQAAKATQIDQKTTSFQEAAAKDISEANDTSKRLQEEMESIRQQLIQEKRCSIELSLEIQTLTKTVEQLQEKLDFIEDIHEQLKKSISAGPNDSPDAKQRATLLSLEDKIVGLMKRLTDAENGQIQSETEVARVTYSLDEANSEIKSLKKRMVDLEKVKLHLV